MTVLRTPTGGISSSATPNPEVPGAWAPLSVLMIGTYMIVLDFFIVNVALPSMQSGLHASAS